jgi:hypothetical protein
MKSLFGNARYIQYIASGYGVPLSEKYYNKLKPFAESISSIDEFIHLYGRKTTNQQYDYEHHTSAKQQPPIIFSENFIKNSNGFILFAPKVYLKLHKTNHYQNVVGPLLFNEKYPKEITDLVHNYYDYKYSDPIFCCNSGCSMCSCVYDGKEDLIKNILHKAEIDYTKTYCDQLQDHKKNKFKEYDGFRTWLLENKQNTIESRIGYYAQILNTLKY